MEGLDLLYEYAEAERISIYFDNISFAKAVTVKDPDGFNVAMDPLQVTTEGEEKVCLMHELSHIATGAFYTLNSDTYYKNKMEHTATRWLILYLIPREEYDAALENGYTEVWDLADFFEVPEDFMRQVIFYYAHGYLPQKT